MGIRIDLPENLAKAVDHYAKVYKVSAIEAINRLLSGLETMLVEGVSLVEIGRDWERIARETRPQPKIWPIPADPGSSGSGELEEGGSSIVPLSELTEANDSNLPQLEVSTKLASGYVGVYSNSSRGWRAQVPVVDDTLPAKPSSVMRFLKTYPMPIQAAISRRTYMLAHGLPYGPLAETIAWLRTRHPEMTEAQLRKEAEELDALKPPA